MAITLAAGSTFKTEGAAPKEQLMGAPPQTHIAILSPLYLILADPVCPGKYQDAGSCVCLTICTLKKITASQLPSQFKVMDLESFLYIFILDSTSL